jgi:hypothetical protein
VPDLDPIDPGSENSPGWQRVLSGLVRWEALLVLLLLASIA